MNMKDFFNSCKNVGGNYNVIKVFADGLRNTDKYLNVSFVKPEENKSFETVVAECFNKIEKSDIIFAITKPDGTFRRGTTYEIEYARRIGKKVKIFDFYLHCLNIKNEESCNRDDKNIKEILDTMDDYKDQIKENDWFTDSGKRVIGKVIDECKNIVSKSQ